MINIFKWISKIFLMEDKDSYIGLTQLRQGKDLVKSSKKPACKNKKNIKTSDLMRGIN